MDGGKNHYTVVIIGSGFGGSMTGLTLAREFDQRKKGETILMLERGTWWTTPVGTVQDKEVKTAEFLRKKNQPVQYWSSVEHFKGFIDLFLRCVRRKGNEDGLYEFTQFRRRGFLGLFGGKNDGVSILRACGVGGGSLVYSNVTIQPPDFIFDDPRWPGLKDKNERNKWFNMARDAIGIGVLYAWEKVKPTGLPDLNKLKINTGLSNINTRSARLDPHWENRTDLSSGREVKHIHLTNETKPPVLDTNDQQLANTPTNRHWVDRARVFQTVMSQLTNDFGTVDSSINDLPPEVAGGISPAVEPKNYCERQGRCNVGCLPGARHTLNKQLMSAIFGTVQSGKGTLEDIMSIQSLAEVGVIRALNGGGYEVQYFQRDYENPSNKKLKSVTADKVIVAAGCVGTNELMLRCKDRSTLPNLSDRLGYGFSTNGDYLAFLENTKERISLTRGPVTTSFAHFQTPGSNKDPNQPADPAKFHTIEDQGIPRALASTLGFGLPLIRSLSKGRNPRLFVFWALVLWFFKRIIHYVRAFFLNYRERQDVFQSEDEYTANMMCIAGMGRATVEGRFELGKSGRDTPLRLRALGLKEFYQDPIYQEMRESLSKFAKQLTEDKSQPFMNPFLTPTADALGAKSIALSHPLGGCRIAQNISEGVVDEFGRVFSKGSQAFYKGLYIADGSIIPIALGVNPSLTIAAVSLRIADKIIQEL